MKRKKKGTHIFAEVMVEIFGPKEDLETDNVTDITGDKRALKNDDVVDFMAAAAERDEPFFEQLEECLQVCAKYRPLRIIRMRKDILWLRHQLHKEGHKWGLPPTL